MPAISKEEQERLRSRVRELLRLGLDEDLIIRQLEISRAAFFRYKKQVINDIKRYYKPKDGELDAYKSMVMKALEDAYNVNKQIMNDSRNSPQSRSLAAEMTTVYRAQQCKLVEEGYIKPYIEPVKKVSVLNEHNVVWPDESKVKKG